jgi:hypothetical protein
MANFNALPRTITAAVGALVISTAFIAAAVAPAHIPVHSDAPTQVASIASSAQAHA